MCYELKCVLIHNHGMQLHVKYFIAQLLIKSKGKILKQQIFATLTHLTNLRDVTMQVG